MSILKTPASIAGFELPFLEIDHKLQRTLSAALAPHSQRSFPREKNTADEVSPWNAEHFGLHQVRLFQDATADERQAILAIANLVLIEEAYWIEQAGVGYMAKMVLMAESQEERMLYGLFTADETYHLAQIRQFLPDLPTQPHDPFLSLLAELIESGNKTVLLFVLQVVLEGWGLTHYRNLARDCQRPELRDCFRDFVQAEARHHGTGLTLFNQAELSDQSRCTILDVLTQFLQMIRVGPQRALSAIAQVKGDLSPAQSVQILEELDTVNHSGTRLQVLRSLMQTSKTHSLIQELSDRGLFDPLPAHLCV